MSVTLGFKKHSWSLYKFCLFFLLILSLYDRKFAGYERLLDDDDDIFDVFATLLKIIVKSFTIHFSDVLQNLREYSKTKQYIDFMKPAVIQLLSHTGSE